MTTRQALYALVEANATEKRPIPVIYSRLYDGFEEHTNTNWRRLAYNACQETLEYLEEKGELEALLAFARSSLTHKPALPGKEKAPVQGSLLEGGLP